MAAVGVKAVALTPHVSAREIAEHGEDVLEQRGEVLEGLRAVAPPKPALVLGFEIMLDGGLPGPALDGRRFSLAGSRYHLVEFPVSVSPWRATDLLALLVTNGVVPLVAHPERYHRVSLRDMRTWRNLGAKLQVDARTLTRHNPRGHKAREMAENGMADVVASDNHGDSRLIDTAVQYLEDRGLVETVHLLAVQNPKAIVEDGLLERVPPVKLSVGVMEKLRRVLRRRAGSSERGRTEND